MLRLILAVVLASVGLAVFFLGRDALLLVVGAGLGVGFAELVDLGVRQAPRRPPRAPADEEDDDRPRGRR